MAQKLIYTESPALTAASLVNEASPAGVFIVADSNTSRIIVPQLCNASEIFSRAELISINAGDVNKNLSAVTGIWTYLSTHGASRRSMIINVGGGMITDLGGFAAATFKRGIRFLNMPTTLLGAVDAAVGGKTGFNFSGLKNEIGVFREADAVIISTAFFNSLDSRELRSGYAEMLKHGLLSGPETYIPLLDFDIETPDFNVLLPLLRESVEIKRKIVAEDPHEHGIRRALNLGHTAGHAFESLAIDKGTPMPHGYAVARGILVELILSHLLLGFPSARMQEYADYIQAYADAPSFTCDDYPAIIDFMRHDKKNSTSGQINFTLLSDVGKPRIDQIIPDDEIKTALDIFRDLMHI